MYDFSYPLGNAVKSTRYQRGLTQLQVAEIATQTTRQQQNQQQLLQRQEMQQLHFQ